MSEQTDYNRNGRLLVRKFRNYLLPSTLTAAALSLNEFVDSMVVSGLLGSKAMAVVNLGMPVMLFMAFVYTLLGSGGATLFARALGEREREYAGTCFRTALLVLSAAGILMTGIGFALFRPLNHLLCRDPELAGPFEGYLRVLLFSAPLITVILGFLVFLPPCGIPVWATVINILANGVNLVMDVVYIRVFHMGVEGAAYATLTGYAVGMIPLLWVAASRRLKIPHGRWFSGKVLKEMTISGGPTSAVQLGYTLKIGFSNGLAVSLGGAAGIVAFSLCIQALSFVSIFLTGADGAAGPLIAVLHGQKDYYGENTVLKSALRVTLISMAVSVAAFLIFPRQIAALYSITAAEELDLAVRALRIFAVTCILRGFCMIVMRYLQAIGSHRFSMFISLFDGCIGIIPISWICARLMGLDGVWAAYPVTALLLTVIVILHNLTVAKRSKGLIRGLLMARQEEPAVSAQSWTIPEEKPAWLSEAVTGFCADSGVSRELAFHAGLVAEELVLFTRENSGKSDYMDVIARQYPDRVAIDFRSLGTPVNPLLPMDENGEDGSPDGQILHLKLLRKMADRLDYEYVMGMNCTHTELGIPGQEKDSLTEKNDENE